MKIVTELNDTDAHRCCPCDKNGKHNHGKCVAAYIENGLLGAAFKREMEAVQQEFQDAYRRPQVTVTTE